MTFPHTVQPLGVAADSLAVSVRSRDPADDLSVDTSAASLVTLELVDAVEPRGLGRLLGPLGSPTALVDGAPVPDSVGANSLQ